MSWTDERVALLKRLWGEGRTAAEIAKELGGITRNAVIGKAHRLKLSRRVSPIQQNNKKAPAKTAAPKAKKPEVARMTRPAVKPVEPVEMMGLSLAELGPKQCRWPSGDPKSENFGFCGCTVAPGMPYCEAHAKMAYQTVSRSRALSEKDFDGVDNDVKKISV